MATKKNTYLHIAYMCSKIGDGNSHLTGDVIIRLGAGVTMVDLRQWLLDDVEKTGRWPKGTWSTPTITDLQEIREDLAFQLEPCLKDKDNITDLSKNKTDGVC